MRIVLSVLLLSVGGAIPALAQPTLAVDLNGAGGSDPEYLRVHEGRLYFAATARAVGRELWAYDAGTGALALAADLQPFNENSLVYTGGYPSHLYPYAGELFFRVDTQDERALWAYDPATGAARRVSETPPGLWFVPSGNLAGPAWFAEYDDRLFYVARSQERGIGLWAYDAATDQAGPVLDTGGDPDPGELTVYAGRLYYSAASGGYGQSALFAYDAAADTAGAVAPGAANPRGLIVVDGALFFSAERGGRRGLWRYDAVSGEAAAVAWGEGLSDPVLYDGRLV